MESAIRTLYELVTGDEINSILEQGIIKEVRGFEDIKYMELTIPKVGVVPKILRGIVDDFEFLRGIALKVAICHGTANAKKVLDNIKGGGIFSQCHFIEFMACPGGCLGGGGQPIPTSKSIRMERAKAIYLEDEHASVRKSYKNEEVLRVYQEFLPEGPASKKSHKYLHTTYLPRGREEVKI